MSNETPTTTYSYLCGECLTESMLTMDEITSHWRGHVAERGIKEKEDMQPIRD